MSSKIKNSYQRRPNQWEEFPTHPTQKKWTLQFEKTQTREKKITTMTPPVASPHSPVTPLHFFLSGSLAGATPTPTATLSSFLIHASIHPDRRRRIRGRTIDTLLAFDLFFFVVFGSDFGPIWMM